MFARQNGAREDAIQSAWERNRDREKDMSALDWVMAINAEAARLNASGLPRPEAIREKQRATQRAGAKRRRQKVDETEPVQPAPLLPAKTGAA